MTGALLLGLDVGTSSTKGVLATPEGVIVARAERPHGLSLPHPGWAEHDSEAIWWADSLAIFRELAAKAPGPIAAVGVSKLMSACSAAKSVQVWQPSRV